MTAVEALMTYCHDRKESIDVAERIMQSGFRSVETPKCLSAAPSTYPEHWEVFVEPIAKYTQSEEERKLLLLKSLLAIGEEVANSKYVPAFRESLVAA